MRLGNHRTKNPSLGAMLLHEIIRAPREIGAVFPSSVRLGDTMAALIGGGEEGAVVELGAGTGVITESLLRSGIAPGRLTVIEKSEPFACYLAQRFPHVRIVHADAGDWPAELGQTAVKAVVSCLPLRSLPASAVARITATWARSLASDGRVIQFTYAPFGTSAWQDAGLRRIGCETVWANFPPARVEVFARP